MEIITPVVEQSSLRGRRELENAKIKDEIAKTRRKINREVKNFENVVFVGLPGMGYNEIDTCGKLDYTMKPK
jgi:hypothetical protein